MTAFTSLEPEARRELLRFVGHDRKLNVLVETGTNQGMTPLALQPYFQKIFTIELDESLFLRAQQMLASFENIECLHGDSTDVLPQVLARIDEPALFWLDGHYSGPGTGHGIKSSPICEELCILFEDGRPHVILIDDARIFDGGTEHTLYPHYLEYPSLEWIEGYAGRFGYEYLLRDDIIRLTP